MRTLSQRIADWLIAWRWPLLALAAVLAVAASFPARSLRFDRSIENMFAPGDPLLAPYEKLKRTFGGNEVVLAAYEDEHLLAPDRSGIERLAEISAQLEEVPGVKGVVSLDQPLGPLIVDPQSALARRTRDLFAGYTHSADGRVAAVVCLLWPEAETDVPREETMEKLREVMRELPSGMIAGEPVLVSDGFRYVEEDGRRLGLWTTVLLAGAIAISFRSVRWVIVPLAVVQAALVWTKASLVLTGLRLSMVSSMLTAIVTVVGIAMVVHVIVRFRLSRQEGLAPRGALSRAGAWLVAPVFWSCATTAVGFASLLTAEVGPVRDFGLMMALGTLVVLVAAALVVPGLALAGRFDTDPHRAWGEGLLDGGLDRVARVAQRWPATIALVAFALAAAAAAGIYRLKVETDFTRNFRADSPIVRSYEFVENRLGGAGLLDVIVPAPKQPRWADMRALLQLEDRLRSEVVVPGSDGRPVPGLTKVLSLADAGVARSPVDLERLRFATIQDRLVKVGMDELREKMPVLMEALHGEDPQEPGRYYLRIMLRARERQPSEQKRAIIRQVERISREEFPPGQEQPGAEVTGFFVLLTRLIDSVLRDQWITFGVATGAIGLMMVVALRSPVLAAVALVPNTLPILIVMGLMGWAGLKINMGAAMIAAVSIGLSIDSSIHYITAFRRARTGGLSLEESLRAVHQSVGRAMFFSVLALVVGFTVLVTSQFVPTIYFGALVSLAMLGGLAGNLLVLPALLRLATRERPGE